MKKYKSYFLFKAILPAIFLFFLGLVLSSCSKTNYSTLPVYQFKAKSGVPDYSNLDYWAAHPWKKDPSDSVPSPLQKNYQPDSVADVFFIHPTTLTDNNDQRWNADIDDAKINAKTDYSSMLYQASVFNEHCRVFAPRYRQAHLKSFYIQDSVSEPYFNLAYEDVRTAFLYYLKYLNKGRPIIIASHSQGTKHAARLMKEFFDGKELYKQLVCAYIVGLPVPKDYFTHIPVCKDSLSTGCFVSWRTFKSGYIDPAFVAKEKFEAAVVNPLVWTTDNNYSSPSYNKGGVLTHFNKIVPHVVSARIHQNVLWSCKPRIFGKIFIHKKNYHVGDINLFYMNIRENIASRIKVYSKLEHL